MGKTSVSDYQIFNNAVSTASTLSSKIQEASKTLDTCKNNLSDNSIFEGPLCEECINGFVSIATKVQEMDGLIDNVKSYLNKASNDYSSRDSNEARSVSDTGSMTNLPSTGTKNEVTSKAVDWALGIADDNSIGYVNGGIGPDKNGGYDCTQFVHAAYEAAGLDLDEKYNVNQANIVDYYTQKGFVWHEGTIDPDELQPGDVLVNQDYHAEMYIGNGQKVGAHNNYDGNIGDSSGEEISVNDYAEYGNGGWHGYLRYEGNDLKK